jgi:rare lipoprotein A
MRFLAVACVLTLLGLMAGAGLPFAGRRTACGQVYDRWAPTAAHKTLPCGTRLRVINPENGRSELVTVTDRGPFIPGRDYDFSQGTARRLGWESRGVAELRVEILP